MRDSPGRVRRRQNPKSRQGSYVPGISVWRRAEEDLVEASSWLREPWELPRLRLEGRGPPMGGDTAESLTVSKCPKLDGR